MSVDLNFSGRCGGVDDLVGRVRRAAPAFGFDPDGLAIRGATLVVRFRGGWDVDRELSPPDPGQGLAVCGSCRTSLGGPGLHAAVADFAEALALDNFAFEDETGYADDRDFDRLSETFLGQLRGYAEFAAESEGKEGPLMLCWPVGPGAYMPADADEALFTPMGRFPRTAWRDAIERDGAAALAEQVYAWPHRAFDATAMRNHAVRALWMDCRFLPSARAAAVRAENAAVLDLLEAAHRADPALPLPLASYRELCELDGREPAIPADAPATDETPRPGYRRGLVEYSPIGLVLPLPGAFRHVDADPEGETPELWCDDGDSAGGTVVRLGTYAVPDEAAALALLAGKDFFPGHREEAELPGGCAVWSWGAATEEEGGPHGYCIARIASGRLLHHLSVSYPGEADWPGVRELLLRLRCRPVSDEELAACAGSDGDAAEPPARRSAAAKALSLAGFFGAALFGLSLIGIGYALWTTDHSGRSERLAVYAMFLVGGILLRLAFRCLRNFFRGPAGSLPAKTDWREIGLGLLRVVPRALGASFR